MSIQEDNGKDTNNFEDLQNKVSSELQKSKKEAEDLIKDPQKTESILKQALQKLGDTKSGPIRELFDNISLMISMVSDWIKGKYKEVPVGSIIAILAALLYFISPIDLIPDFIVGVGYIDDAFVVAIVIRQIYADLQEYKKWKENNGVSVA